MNPAEQKDPLQGVTLEKMLTILVEERGWPALAEHVKANCFWNEPTIKSSLKFLRKFPWARARVEGMYLWHLRELKREGR